MKKVLFLLVFVLSIFNVLAHEHNFNEIEQLIDSGISCDDLRDEQLEAIGEYYMEQMHPGEAHELMDKMMGGDDSESLREMHINMAKMLYCNEDVGGMMSSGGMMGMMSMMGNNMMDGGMMNFGGGDMIGWNYGGFGMNFFGFLIPLLVTVVLILLIFWLIRQISKKK